MKKILLGLAALLISGSTPTAAFTATVSDYPAGAAANGITSSRHNMGLFGPVITAAETTEICVFCHTPHHTNTSVSPAPLWNRVNKDRTGNTVAYTAYGTTLGGNSASSVGSVSLACLSCHDGVTTFDTLVNAPGKDGVTQGGLDQGWQFGMPGLSFPLGPAWHTEMDRFSSWTCSVCHQGLNFQKNIPRLIIGTDLGNDHPVSISYNADVASLRPASTIISSIDLTSGLAASAVSAFTGNLSQNRWAVKGFVSNTARIDDLLKNGKVECSSCHDPHFKNRSWDESESTWVDPYIGYTNWCGNDPERCSDGQFLRRVGGNTGSAVCRTCHNK